MLGKATALYSKNNKNQQFYEYLVLVIFTIQLAVLSNFAIFNTHPIAIIDILVKSAIVASLVLPIFVARELRLINNAARFFLAAPPGRIPMNARAGKIEQKILVFLGSIKNQTQINDRQLILSTIIDRDNQIFVMYNYMYIIPFILISLMAFFVSFDFHDAVLDLIRKEPPEQSMRVSSVSEIHRSKTTLMTNLIWATVALQTASTLAIKAAHSDLRHAVEGWLTNGPIESMPAATSSPAAPSLVPPA